MKRFNWGQMKRYWEIHSSSYAQFDYGADKDGLTNVCSQQLPLWTSKYYADYQKAVYEKLFSLMPLPKAGSRALDIGCGAGRWCCFLADRGYSVTGVDLQPELIEKNSIRYPEIKFFNIPVQDYHPEEPFELISSVTVLQHIPFEEQRKVINRLREMLKTNGYLLVLESIRDQGPQVFSNNINGWKSMFEDAGLRCVAIKPHDYNFCGRIYYAIKKRFIFNFCGPRFYYNDADLTPETFLSRHYNKDKISGWDDLLYAFNKAVRILTIVVDNAVEPVFFYCNIPLPTVQCGFLFKKV